MDHAQRPTSAGASRWELKGLKEPPHRVLHLAAAVHVAAPPVPRRFLARTPPRPRAPPVAATPTAAAAAAAAAPARWRAPAAGGPGPARAIVRAAQAVVAAAEACAAVGRAAALAVAVAVIALVVRVQHIDQLLALVVHLPKVLGQLVHVLPSAPPASPPRAPPRRAHRTLRARLGDGRFGRTSSSFLLFSSAAAFSPRSRSASSCASRASCFSASSCSLSDLFSSCSAATSRRSARTAAGSFFPPTASSFPAGELLAPFMLPVLSLIFLPPSCSSGARGHYLGPHGINVRDIVQAVSFWHCGLTCVGWNCGFVSSSSVFCEAGRVNIKAWGRHERACT